MKKQFKLKISFQEKDSVKALAIENGTKIKWEPQQKFWYWEGEKLPEFLTPYHKFNTQECTSAALYYYICQPNHQDWYFVEKGSFQSREELKSAIMKEIKACNDNEDVLILSNFCFIAANKKIREGKNIHRAWVAGKNTFHDLQDIEIKEAYQAAVNYEYE